MALLPILTWPDARLNKRCVEVKEITPGVQQLAADMLETMYAAKGRGLAGPQVGAMLRLFVMDTTWKEGTPAPRVVINPDILWMSDARSDGPEGCLSLPGITTQINRALVVRLRYAGLDGVLCDAELDGFDAICAQHEFDHLDGIVTLNRLTPEARAIAEKQYFL